MSPSEDHYIAIFRFKPESRSLQRGDDVYYIRERMNDLLKELKATASVEVCTLSSL